MNVSGIGWRPCGRQLGDMAVEGCETYLGKPRPLYTVSRFSTVYTCGSLKSPIASSALEFWLAATPWGRSGSGLNWTDGLQNAATALRLAGVEL